MKSWKYIIPYFIFACLISGPFVIWRDLYSEHWFEFPYLHLRNLAIMSGPGISALICYLYFKGHIPIKITLTGTSILNSILFFSIPYLVFLVLLFFLDPVEDWGKPLLYIPFGFIMILGEEYGWRGYLHNVMQHWNKWKKYIVIGLLWEFWHLTRGLTHGDLQEILMRKVILIIVTIILSIIIGWTTDKTRSIVTAVSIHTWVNLQFEFQSIATFVTGGVSIGVWSVVLFLWDRNSTNSLQRKETTIS